MNSFGDFLLTLFLTTILQIWIVFGIFFILGLILYIFSKYTRKIFINAGMPKIDLVITAWIGTPVHELGHALFCLLFGHKIKEIKLFKLDKSDGTLGYVTHSFNTKNIYHLIGNFFIGAGPLIFGSIVLITLLYFFIPTSDSIISIFHSTISQEIDFSNFLHSIIVFVQAAYSVLQSILVSMPINSWQFWVYLYVSISIASHMQLSPPDIKTMFRGLLVIIAGMFLLNILFVIWEYDINAAIVRNFKVGFAYSILVLAIIISGFNYLFSYIFMFIIYAVKQKKILKPF